tara:strand:- start:9179 stop:9505 length:327 start_codon:yes stop_codon:yes gene_type:complete
MKKLIALTALMVALPSFAEDRSYQIENMLAGFYACYWHYEEQGDSEKAGQFLSEHQKMSSSYAIYLGDRNKIDRSSRNMIKLAHEYPDKNSMNELCLMAHDKFIKPTL